MSSSAAVALAMIALAGLAAPGWPPAAPAGAAEASVAEGGATLLPVRAAVVRHQEGYVVEERYLGRVRARRTSALGFERGGRVAAVLVEEGETVEAGQPIARLDAATQDAALRTAEAALATRLSAARVAESELDAAERTFARVEELMRGGNVSAQRFDDAEAALRIASDKRAVAEAGVAEARARVAEAALAIGRATLRAPFAGVVLDRFVDEGTVVAAGAPVLRLAETAALELRAGLPAATAARLSPGETHAVEIAGRRVSAMLTAVIGAVDAESRTVPAIFALPADMTAPIGGVGAALIATRREGRGFWAPLDALAPDRRGLWRVLALEPEAEGSGVHRVSPRAVLVIHREPGRVFVRGAFDEGERFVATGLNRLAPGQRVRLP